MLTSAKWIILNKFTNALLLNNKISYINKIGSVYMLYIYIYLVCILEKIAISI